MLSSLYVRDTESLYKDHVPNQIMFKIWSTQSMASSNACPLPPFVCPFHNLLKVSSTVNDAEDSYSIF